MMTVYVDYINGKSSRHGNIHTIHWDMSQLPGYIHLYVANTPPTENVNKYLNTSHIVQMTVVEESNVTP